jgi:hypothetical protein
MKLLNTQVLSIYNSRKTGKKIPGVKMYCPLGSSSGEGFTHDLYIDYEDGFKDGIGGGDISGKSVGEHETTRAKLNRATKD